MILIKRYWWLIVFFLIVIVGYLYFMLLFLNFLLLLWIIKLNFILIYFWLEKVWVCKLCCCNLSINGSYMVIDGNVDVVFVGNWINVEVWCYFYVNIFLCFVRWDIIYELCNGKRMKWRWRLIVYILRFLLWLLNDILNFLKFENLR